MSVQLVLASASAARRALLTAAGLTFEVMPAEVDEADLKMGLTGSSPAEIATRLAAAKAAWVSVRHPAALVIGADQTLDLDGALFDKPADLAMARTHLARLRGRTHTLHAAIALATAGKVTWSHIAEAFLTMRTFSDSYLTEYLNRAGEAVCSSVGAYQIEGLGMNLFERIEGDHTTILGLPMLPLLGELRRRQHLPV